MYVWYIEIHWVWDDVLDIRIAKSKKDAMGIITKLAQRIVRPGDIASRYVIHNVSRNQMTCEFLDGAKRTGAVTIHTWMQYVFGT